MRIAVVSSTCAGMVRLFRTRAHATGQVRQRGERAEVQGRAAVYVETRQVLQLADAKRDRLSLALVRHQREVELAQGWHGPQGG